MRRRMPGIDEKSKKRTRQGYCLLLLHGGSFNSNIDGSSSSSDTPLRETMSIAAVRNTNFSTSCQRRTQRGRRRKSPSSLWGPSVFVSGSKNTRCALLVCCALLGRQRGADEVWAPSSSPLFVEGFARLPSGWSSSNAALGEQLAASGPRTFYRRREDGIDINSHQGDPLLVDTVRLDNTNCHHRRRDALHQYHDGDASEKDDAVVVPPADVWPPWLPSLRCSDDRRGVASTTSSPAVSGADASARRLVKQGRNDEVQDDKDESTVARRALARAEEEIQWIQYELLRRENWSTADIRVVVGTLRYYIHILYKKEPGLAMGVLQFVQLLFLEEPRRDELDDDVDDDGAHHPLSDESNALVTREVLLASIQHYVECIDARQQGLEHRIRSFLFRRRHYLPDASALTVSPSSSSLPLRLPCMSATCEDADATNVSAEENRFLRVLTDEDREFVTVARSTPGRGCGLSASSSPSSKPSVIEQKRDGGLLQVHGNSSQYDAAVMRIAHGAARIKRAEILAHVVLGQQKKPGRSSSSDIAPLSREEIGRVRGLLLSVMDDWRSLAIRCVACLYRLQGILKTLEAEDDGDCRNNPSLVDTERTPLMVREAREAMHVYGPLAEQLGFHRLKSAIEQRAFEILYRRQHRAVSSLFREKGDVMRKLSRFLLSSVSSLLREDEAFMSQLEDLRVTTRVKEPYSFWRKLLKARKKKKIDRLRLLTAGQTSSGLETVGGSTLKHPTNRILRPSFPSPDLSIANVQDGIALRVILKARKWSDEEPDEETRARERLLCYYGQHLIRKRWPEVSPSRIKDYIDNPKPNGYRSLHHTSLVSFNGADYFPFEVQIRSEEMHRAAEFGVAAHWDYKLSGQSPSVVATDESSPGAGSSMPPVGFIQEGSDGTGSVRLSDPDFEDDVYKSPSQIEATEAEISPPLGSSHLDALVTAKESLVKERVHVFVVGGSGFEERGGSILSLPRRSSTVGDALRLALRGTTSESPTYPSSSMPSMLPFTGFVGEALDGTDTVALSLPPPPLSYTVWKNGVLVDVYDKLENGDVLVVDAAMASRPAVLLPESCG